MQTLIDFLTFKTLISEYVLIFFYYLGALILPIVAWTLSLFLVRRFTVVRQVYRTGMGLFSHMVPVRFRITMLLMFLLALVCMELVWRLMFEYLIAFMQIRDALVQEYPTSGLPPIL